ncbi:synaptojanin-2-binding protein isoform X1 [Epinephelus moara]|uniref:synaptojanin-2-binding protein isoform X1 n=1 Tax=Epinephelus moara TaxID=300413 RepID=UPI00214ED6EC|nr:synaptojanin-2-binding protein isoform X1 [Epinephelus moara]
MNGSLHSSPDVVDIKLKRGPAGLGFNIVGGVDQQYVMNDSGIYVSKIKDDGAAAVDGRLQEGDKILAINGVKLEDLTHRATVDLFRTAGEDVELRVMKKEKKKAWRQERRGSHRKKGVRTLMQLREMTSGEEEKETSKYRSVYSSEESNEMQCEVRVAPGCGECSLAPKNPPM